jgi:hypothetical protein
MQSAKLDVVVHSPKGEGNGSFVQSTKSEHRLYQRPKTLHRILEGAGPDLNELCCTILHSVRPHSDLIPPHHRLTEAIRDRIGVLHQAHFDPQSDVSDADVVCEGSRDHQQDPVSAYSGSVPSTIMASLLPPLLSTPDNRNPISQWNARCPASGIAGGPYACQTTGFDRKTRGFVADAHQYSPEQMRRSCWRRLSMSCAFRSHVWRTFVHLPKVLSLGL